MSGPPILIVDDNPANAKLLSFLLAKHGYEVRTAVDAQNAMEILREFTPRLIFMDIQMPGMNGFELTQRLKANPEMQGILVIALTSYAMKGDAEKATLAGCDGYITKPVDTRTLPAMVAKYLGDARGPFPSDAP